MQNRPESTGNNVRIRSQLRALRNQHRNPIHDWIASAAPRAHQSRLIQAQCAEAGRAGQLPKYARIEPEWLAGIGCHGYWIVASVLESGSAVLRLGSPANSRSMRSFVPPTANS
jgi:hypothetical protein